MAAPSLAPQDDRLFAVRIAQECLAGAVLSLNGFLKMLNRVMGEQPLDPVKVERAEAKVERAKAGVERAEAEVDMERSRAPGSPEHDQFPSRVSAFLHATKKLHLAERKVSLADAQLQLANARQGGAQSRIENADVLVENLLDGVRTLEGEISVAMSNLLLNAAPRSSAPAPAPVDAVVPFTPDPLAQKFVTALMSTGDADIRGSPGMSVVDLRCEPLSSNFPVPILLRQATLPFWKAVVDTLQQRDESPNGRTKNCVAVGSPGTGKSSTIPILIRMLLQRTSTMAVVLEVRQGPLRAPSFVSAIRSKATRGCRAWRIMFSTLLSCVMRRTLCW